VTNQLAQAKLAVDSAQSALDLKTNRPREIDLASYRAQVAQAQASLNLSLANLDKTRLLAPADGIVTEIKNEVGENVTSASNFITMISQQMKIEVDVPETDVVKIHLHDKVSMTFDALGYDKKFTGEVIEIDPAPTEISGVIYYQAKVILGQDAKDNVDIKPGMTANLEILAAKVDNVLTVPFRAVKNKNGGSKYVQILENNQPKDVDVEVGLEGEALIEIKSGLQEGQSVITFAK
jgi:RND family efflux transporter MFP subunit